MADETAPFNPGYIVIGKTRTIIWRRITKSREHPIVIYDPDAKPQLKSVSGPRPTSNYSYQDHGKGSGGSYKLIPSWLLPRINQRTFGSTGAVNERPSCRLPRQSRSAQFACAQQSVACSNSVRSDQQRTQQRGAIKLINSGLDDQTTEFDLAPRVSFPGAINHLTILQF